MMTLKRIFFLIPTLVFVLSTESCSLLYELEPYALDNYTVGYSEYYKNAYLGGYHYDLSEEGRNMVLPEEYMGYPIVAAHGFSGRGYPASLHVMFDTDNMPEAAGCEVSAFGDCEIIDYFTSPSIEYVDFHLTVSKNLKDISGASLGGGLILERVGDGVTKVYICRFYVSCHEENETYYAEEGKLYNKSDGTLVDNITYFDYKYASASIHS